MEPSSSKSWLFKTVAIEGGNLPTTEGGNLPTTEGGNLPTTEGGNLPTTEVVAIVETPEHSPEFYLKLTTKCMKGMNKMLSSTPKFNQEQCKYLANKLDVALKSTHSIIDQVNTLYSSSNSLEEMLEYLEIFKLLFLMGLEAEGFIQNCYKDGWIQSAIMLANVSERIGSIGFNLELCSIIFSKAKLGRFKSFTTSEIANLHEKEASTVKEKAILDEKKLFVDLGEVTQLSMPNSTECQLATFLLQRLQSAKLQPGIGLPTSYEFSHSKLSMRSVKQMESLGKGASATVYRSSWLGVEVAKKTFDGPSNPDFLREVSILASLSHPNIVSLLWYMIDHRKNHIIMELMDGDLYTFMQARLAENGYHGNPFSISEALDLMLQIAEGMLYLYEKRIVHRDLKSSNILVKCGKATKLDFKYVQAKVADFGLSKTKELSMTYSQQTQNMGTTRWMAPEMIKLGNDDGQAKEEAAKHPFKSDVHSFGMVCFEILTGDLPFTNMTNSEIKKVVLSGGRPQLPHECPNELKTLIEACWNSEASSRPHFGDICAELRRLKFIHLTCVWAKIPRSFSLDEIKEMTNGFDEGRRFGLDKVYKSVMVDTSEVVAVEKVQHNCDLCSPRIWLIVLPRLHHQNLMGYIGFCYENGEKILVFEYMPNYTLAGWLLGDEHGYHCWAVRRNICVGVANGIHYLHSETLAKINHRSINLRTIYLDANLTPKVGGFWKDCTIPDIGSDKEDVYNFGVVLLEIVSRRIVRKVDRLQNWAQELYFKGNIRTIIDPDLHFQTVESSNEAIKFIKIAMLCIHNNAQSRPNMTYVVAMLEGNMDKEIKNLSIQHKKERERDTLQLQGEFSIPDTLQLQGEFSIPDTLQLQGEFSIPDTQLPYYMQVAVELFEGWLL